MIAKYVSPVYGGKNPWSSILRGHFPKWHPHTAVVFHGDLPLQLSFPSREKVPKWLFQLSRFSYTWVDWESISPNVQSTEFFLKVTSYRKRHGKRSFWEVVWGGMQVQGDGNDSVKQFLTLTPNSNTVLSCIAAICEKEMRNSTPVLLTSWVSVHETRRMISAQRTAFASQALR